MSIARMYHAWCTLSGPLGHGCFREIVLFSMLPCVNLAARRKQKHLTLGLQTMGYKRIAEWE